MSYQLRHKRLGIYQGICNRMVLWYSKSKADDIGVYKFEKEKDAKSVVGLLISGRCVGEIDTIKGTRQLNRTDFIIEPFDEDIEIEIRSKKWEPNNNDFEDNGDLIDRL